MLLFKICEKKSTGVVAYVLIVLLITVAGPTLAIADDRNAPVLDMPDENFSDSGYIKIKWTGAEGSSAEYQLELSASPGFENPEIIYEGPDRASFISGLPNGDYYFRVRAVSGGDTSPWSSPVLVKVKHHSLAMAFSLASVGILVFLLTVGVVISGIRKDKES